MNVLIDIDGTKYSADLNKPLILSIPLIPGGINPRCFNAEKPDARPVISGNFIGSVPLGSPVNFYKTTITPHGNGTHTECVGHISPEMETVNTSLSKFHFSAEIISLSPQEEAMEDLIISRESLEAAVQFRTEALIIRTLPNSKDKRERDYSGNNPPYLSPEAMDFIVEQGYDHLLIDLPSVDKEQDGGSMAAHKRFWNFPTERETGKTITELIYIEDEIRDGLYLLNLQIPNIALDAVPSNPVIYQLEEKK